MFCQYSFYSVHIYERRAHLGLAMVLIKLLWITVFSCHWRCIPRDNPSAQSADLCVSGLHWMMLWLLASSTILCFSKQKMLHFIVSPCVMFLTILWGDFWAQTWAAPFLIIVVLPLIECLLCSRNYAKRFIYIIRTSFSFYTWGKWGSEMLSNLLKIAQLVWN